MAKTYKTASGGGTNARSMPKQRGGAYGHRGTQGSGPVAPVSRGTQGSVMTSNCKAKGVQGRGG